MAETEVSLRYSITPSPDRCVMASYFYLLSVEQLFTVILLTLSVEIPCSDPADLESINGQFDLTIVVFVNSFATSKCLLYGDTPTSSPKNLLIKSAIVPTYCDNRQI